MQQQNLSAYRLKVRLTRLINNGTMDIAANARVESVNVEINLADVAGGSFNLTPYAEGDGP